MPGTCGANQKRKLEKRPGVSSLMGSTTDGDSRRCANVPPFPPTSLTTNKTEAMLRLSAFRRLRCALQLHNCTDRARRAEWVVNATAWAWDAYVKFAWHSDELNPVSKRGSNDLGGLGATVVDSIDTLHLMGLHSRVEEARGFVSKMSFRDRDTDISVFETTIRVEGGLLSAYQLTGDSVFLEK